MFDLDRVGGEMKFARCVVPPQQGRHSIGNTWSHVEALIATDQGERSAAGEHVGDRAGAIVHDGEIDLGP